MPKFFVFSDAHSFYTELRQGLAAAGYDPNNEDHWLVSCGDNFDRGKEPMEMFKFLMRSPRIIFVRGNHEDLLEDMCMRGFPFPNDKKNHTMDTIMAFDPKAPVDVACDTAYHILRPLMWKMRNYFETKNYVFVHGWIPIVCQSRDTICDYAIPSACHGACQNPEWRNMPYSEWESARWKNGMDMAENGLIIPDKTIVCGHWFCSYGHFHKKLREHSLSNGELALHSKDHYDYYLYGEGADFNPYYDEGIIAIDTCTVLTHKVNVLVLEDEFLEGEDLNGLA